MSDENVFEKVESDVTDVSEAETPDPRHDEAGESSPQEGKPKRKPAAIAAGAVAHDAHPRRKQSIGTQHLGAVSGCRMRAERCMATEPTGLIFFDIDGTLSRGVSSGTFIADRLGIGEQMRAAEEAYARGEMDNAAVCRVDAAGYAGLTVAEVETWLDDMPLIDGIDQALALCREASLVPYVASCAWSYIGAYLARRFGFAGWCGPELEVVEGVFTGRIAHDADERAKPAFARDCAAALDVSLAACLAVGDSRSDIPLFKTVGASLALNASSEARFAATCTWDGPNLADAVRHFLHECGRLG